MPSVFKIAIQMNQPGGLFLADRHMAMIFHTISQIARPIIPAKDQALVPLKTEAY